VRRAFLSGSVACEKVREGRGTVSMCGPVVEEKKARVSVEGGGGRVS
jgi:hypothetical protein